MKKDKVTNISWKKQGRRSISENKKVAAKPNEKREDHKDLVKKAKVENQTPPTEDG